MEHGSHHTSEPSLAALLPTALPVKSATTKLSGQPSERHVQNPAARSSTTGNDGTVA